MFARGTRDSSAGRFRQQMLHTELIEVGDHRRSHGLHRTHGNNPLAAPGIHGRQESIAVRRRVTRPAQQFSNTLALGLRLRRLRSPSGRRHHAPLVRYRRALAQDLHRQAPHYRQAISQAGKVAASQTAHRLRLPLSCPQWPMGCPPRADTAPPPRARLTSPTLLRIPAAWPPMAPCTPAAAARPRTMNRR